MNLLAQIRCVRFFGGAWDARPITEPFAAAFGNTLAASLAAITNLKVHFETCFVDTAIGPPLTGNRGITKSFRLLGKQNQKTYVADSRAISGGVAGGFPDSRPIAVLGRAWQVRTVAATGRGGENGRY